MTNTTGVLKVFSDFKMYNLALIGCENSSLKSSEGRGFLSNQIVEDLNEIELNRSFFDFGLMALL